MRYNVSNWLEKNKDPLNDTVIAHLKASTNNELIKTVWADFQTQEEQMIAQKKGAILRPNSVNEGAFQVAAALERARRASRQR